MALLVCERRKSLQPKRQGTLHLLLQKLKRPRKLHLLLLKPTKMRSLRPFVQALQLKPRRIRDLCLAMPTRRCNA